VWRENVVVSAEEKLNPKLANIASEIVETERTYNEGLKVVVNSFLLRLKMHVEMQKPLLAAEIIDQVFHNIEDLYALSAKLSEDLQEIQNEKVILSQIATTLLHYSPQFRIYQPYLENYDIASKAIHAARKSNPDLDFFLRLTEKCEGLALDAYLVLPIQRLPRYQLLLAELRKATPAEDPTLGDITEAFNRIKNIADAINDSLHLKDSVEKVRAVQAMFEKDARYMDLVTPTRVLIREGPLKKKYSKDSRQLASAKNYHFFLFNDILLYASSAKGWNKTTYKLKHYHPLLELEVESQGNTVNPSKKSKDNPAMDITVKVKSGKTTKVFVVSAADETERDAWYTSLKDTIANCKASSKELTVSKFDGSAKKTTVTKSSKLAALTGT
jgi:hypothetical protein